MSAARPTVFSVKVTTVACLAKYTTYSAGSKPQLVQLAPSSVEYWNPRQVFLTSRAGRAESESESEVFVIRVRSLALLAEALPMAKA